MLKQKNERVERGMISRDEKQKNEEWKNLIKRRTGEEDKNEEQMRMSVNVKSERIKISTVSFLSQQIYNEGKADRRKGDMSSSQYVTKKPVSGR